VREKISTRLAATAAAATLGTLATKTATGTTAAGASGGAMASGAGIAAGAVAKGVVAVVLLGAAATTIASAVNRRGETHAVHATPPSAAPVPPAPPILRGAPHATHNEPEKRDPPVVAIPTMPPAPPSVPSTDLPLRALARDRVSATPIAPPVPEAARSAPQPSELELLEAMNAALARGDAAATLGLASEHARLYPAGALVEEREGARALALCLVGTTSVAQEFLNAHPGSPLVGRLRTACSGQ
jgi:hypothetical protein